jgi:hypothetical protein
MKYFVTVLALLIAIPAFAGTSPASAAEVTFPKQFQGIWCYSEHSNEKTMILLRCSEPDAGSLQVKARQFRERLERWEHKPGNFGDCKPRTILRERNMITVHSDCRFDNYGSGSQEQEWEIFDKGQQLRVTDIWWAVVHAPSK